MDLNQVNPKSGRNILFYAIEKNDQALFAKLLSLKGSDGQPKINLNHINKWKNSALLRALTLNRVDMAKALLALNPNILQRNQWGSNALLWATKKIIRPLPNCSCRLALFPRPLNLCHAPGLRKKESNRSIDDHD